MPAEPKTSDRWAELKLAVWQYYDSIDSDCAEFIAAAEAKVTSIAASFGMTFRQALDACGTGAVFGVPQL